VCVRTRELGFHFGVPCAGCTSCSLQVEVHVSKFDMVEFPYRAGYGTWRLPLDAFYCPVREFAESCLLGAST